MPAQKLRLVQKTAPGLIRGCSQRLEDNTNKRKKVCPFNFFKVGGIKIRKHLKTKNNKSTCFPSPFSVTQSPVSFTLQSPNYSAANRIMATVK